MNKLTASEAEKIRLSATFRSDFAAMLTGIGLLVPCVACAVSGNLDSLRWTAPFAVIALVAAVIIQVDALVSLKRLDD